jgi:hypothetical protein
MTDASHFLLLECSSYTYTSIPNPGGLVEDSWAPENEVRSIAVYKILQAYLA